MLVLGIFLTLGVGAIIIQFFEIAEKLRKEIAEKPIFTAKKFPRKIEDIEKNELWDQIFKGYYIKSQNIESLGILFLGIGILLGISIVVIEFNKVSLNSVLVDHNITLLHLVRGIHFCIIVFWVVNAFLFWLNSKKLKQKLTSIF